MGLGAPPRKRRLRPRLPRTLNTNLLIVLVFGPAVLLAHDTAAAAVLLPIALLASATVGYYFGRSDLAMELFQGEARRLDGLRRDDPAA